jgi:hypothetical protein
MVYNTHPVGEGHAVGSAGAGAARSNCRSDRSDGANYLLLSLAENWCDGRDKRGIDGRLKREAFD